MTRALRRTGPQAVATRTVGPASAWRALLDGLPLAAWVVALDDHRVVAANAAAAELLGRSLPDLLGAPAAELLTTPEDISWWDELAATPDAPPDRLRSDSVLSGPDGRLRHVERCIAPLSCDDACAPHHVLVTVRDRSAEQRTGDEHDGALAELRATLEATADGILVTDLAGRIRSFNHRFAQMWGMPWARCWPFPGPAGCC